MTKNYTNLLKFLQSKNTPSNTLVINNIEESINYFYLYWIKHHIKTLNYEIIFKDESHENISSDIDLFNQQKIFIYLKGNIRKKLEKLQTNEKQIFFLDYKSFKSFSPKYLSINTYDLKKDIEFFLKNDLDINNKEISDFILINPEYTYSEISKLTINENYEQVLIKKNDDKLANIRKEIFQSKNMQSVDLINLYNLIKKEVKLKSFNFLTF